MPPTNPSEPARNIVLLEIHAERRNALAEYLTQMGFGVTAVDNMAALRSMREERSVAFFIVGEWTERLGDRDIIETIRGFPKGGLYPILQVLSGDARNTPHEQADYHLAEPFQNKQLVGLLNHSGASGTWTRPHSGPSPMPSTLPEPLGFPEQGQSSQVPFAQVFIQMWTAARSGAIILKAGTTIRRVDFLNGFPVFARSNMVTEHVIRFLLRLNVISPNAYRQLLSQAQQSDWDPSESLVGEGVIEAETYNEVRSELAREVILQCFKWSGAAYRFSPELLTEPREFIEDLNPFELYRDWLGDLEAAGYLNVKVSHLLGSGLVGRVDLTSNRQLLFDLLSVLPPRAVPFDGSQSVSSLIRDAADDDLVKRVLVTLVDFHQLEVVPIRKQEHPATGVPAVTSPGRKFERIRQMVSEDEARSERAITPYSVLGLAEGASASEVNARYQRYRRFYKPENFERIGDADLLERAQDLLASFRHAATEILGKAPAEIAAPTTARHLALESGPDQETAVLAEVFYDDGNTYLRIGELKEAQEHFRRCTKLVPENPKYLSQLGWVTYQAGQGNMLEVAKAKQTLLNALKLDPRNDRALHYLGCLYEDGRQLEKAIECWSKAVKINPANYEAQSALRRIKAR